MTHHTLTLLKALLHMGLILRVEKVKTGLSKQLWWCVPKKSHHTLVHKCEFSLHRVARDELSIVVGTTKVTGVGC